MSSNNPACGPLRRADPNESPIGAGPGPPNFQSSLRRRQFRGSQPRLWTTSHGVGAVGFRGVGRVPIVPGSCPCVHIAHSGFFGQPARRSLWALTGTSRWELALLTVTLVVAFLNLGLLGAVYGAFFTYSNSVVPGLDNADAEKAVEAMRKMNISIINPAFMATFVGPVVTSAVTGVLLLGIDEATAGVLYLVAAGVYLLGCLVVTGRINVPLNNALANSTSTDWARRWNDFSPRWRRWNTVRTVSSGVALVLCGVGLYLWGNG